MSASDRVASEGRTSEKERGDASLVEFASLRAFPELLGVVSTRVGGFSKPPFDSLNLGLSVPDHVDDVVRNRRRLFELAEVAPARVVVCRQVHSNRVAEVGHEDGGRGALETETAIPECDGLLTTERDLYLLVQSADCPTVAIFAPPSAGVTVVHSGWRGTAHEIARCAVEKLHAATDVEVSEFRAVLAPAIGGCCYEVGAEVIDAIAHAESGVRSRHGGDKAMLCLRSVIARQLEDAGIPKANIETHPHCTHCSPGRYYSYRLTGARTGRFGLLAGIRERVLDS